MIGKRRRKREKGKTGRGPVELFWSRTIVSFLCHMVALTKKQEIVTHTGKKRNKRIKQLKQKESRHKTSMEFWSGTRCCGVTSTYYFLGPPDGEKQNETGKVVDQYRNDTEGFLLCAL